METKFQTSFIPKKPIAPVIGTQIPSAHKPRTSLFMAFASLVFIASLASIAGIYAWKKILVSSQENYKRELNLRETRFDIDTIERLKLANIKIDMTKQLLSRHIALSQIFDIIGKMTAENIRFLSLNLKSSDLPGGDLEMTMSGYGSSLSAVAFQSDVFNQLERYGLRKIIKNPILANPTLQQGGSVSFSFSATLDPNTLSYQKYVTGVEIEPEPVEGETSQQ